MYYNKQLFILLSLVFILITTPMSSVANGKFYYLTKIPSDVPYQRALLIHDDQEEVLLLQSSFRGNPDDFGWVVPLPAVPDLHSMNPDSAESIFRALARNIQPLDVIDMWEYLWLVFVIAIICRLFFLLLRFLFRLFQKSPQLKEQPPRQNINQDTSLVPALIILIRLPLLMILIGLPLLIIGIICTEYFNIENWLTVFLSITGPVLIVLGLLLYPVHLLYISFQKLKILKGESLKQKIWRALPDLPIVLIFTGILFSVFGIITFVPALPGNILIGTGILLLSLGVLLKIFFAGGSETIVIFILILFVSIFVPSYQSMGVMDVLKDELVGPYHIRVISADQPTEIIEWLQEHSFNFDHKDIDAFGQYIDKNWVFVTIRFKKENDVKNTEQFSPVMSNPDLVSPLLMRFPSQNAVYPMALTGTGGGETEILLYLYSNYKPEINSDIELSYFDAVTDSVNFLKRTDMLLEGMDLGKINYITKYEGRLGPEQMQEDWLFKASDDKKPYRKINLFRE